MGFFTKSFLILVIAVSTPLVYRQFATDKTITFMSSYYSNYKVVDRFLRQSAGHLDRAQDYLPNSDQVKGVVGKINEQVLDVIEQIKSKVASKEADLKDKKLADKKAKRSTAKPSTRMSNCPDDGKPVRVWTKEELAEFGGSDGKNIYLGFLGLVYDVSANMQHYASEAEYNAFAGRDATRAFITGNFTHDLHDDLTGIEESLYSHIEGWMSFYSTSYPILGRIIGRFYDSNGCATRELNRVFQIFSKLAQEKNEERKQEVNFPDCNSEWNGDLKKGRVWCSKMSGGIERDWVGVPRLYDNGSAPRCACVNLDAPEAAKYSSSLSLYPDCDPQASECSITQ